jgi:Domain of unknown function (DUF4188)
LRNTGTEYRAERRTLCRLPDWVSCESLADAAQVDAGGCCDAADDRRAKAQSRAGPAACAVFRLLARRGGIQYWRSFELLHAYAHARDAAHLPAWAQFNKRIGSSGTAGIWHETYTIALGQYESIYANMPRFGLGSAVKHVPVSVRMDSACSRIEQANSQGPDQKL